MTNSKNDSFVADPGTVSLNTSTNLSGLRRDDPSRRLMAQVDPGRDATSGELGPRAAHRRGPPGAGGAWKGRGGRGEAWLLILLLQGWVLGARALTV